MKSHPFKKLDAFATAASSGNPAGAVYLDSFDAITKAEMLRIARELKGFVSEVGYVVRLAPDAVRLRYFSSEKEVAFCGHATIAILHDLFRQEPALERILVHTRKGVLPVESRAGAVFIQAPEPVFTECRIEARELCEALNLPESALEPSVAVGIVNAGNQTLCVPLRTCREVTDAAPDFRTLLAFCDRNRLDVITLFSTQTAQAANQLRTRVFAAPFGYLEDPATGSGNAALGHHLHRLGRWDGSPLRIEQNADLENPNLVLLGSLPDPAHGIRVTFGGGAILRIDGRYWL